MATEQGMSGIDTKAITQELCEKMPLWIDKVYQFDSRTLGIRLNGEEHAKYLFLIESGRRGTYRRGFPGSTKEPPTIRHVPAEISLRRQSAFYPAAWP